MVNVESSPAGIRGSDVCRIAGCTYRQLDYWARTDLVRPSVQDAVGSGSQRLYSADDVVLVVVVAVLLGDGVSLQQARRIVVVARDGTVDDGPLWLVAADDDCLLTADLPAALFGLGRLVRVLDLRRVIDETREAVSARFAASA